MVLTWTPFVIDMPFGAHADGALADGIAWMLNFIFFILVGMVFSNLIVIWKLEKAIDNPLARQIAVVKKL